MNRTAFQVCNHIDHEPVSHTAKECPVCKVSRELNAEIAELKLKVVNLKRFAHQPVSCRVTPAGVSFFANHHPHDGGCIDGLPVHADEELAEVGMGAVNQD